MRDTFKIRSEEPDTYRKIMPINMVICCCYSKELTDNFILNLAITDNNSDVGSLRPRWVDKVTICRRLLFSTCQPRSQDINNDVLPSLTREMVKSWRKACFVVYADEQVINLYKGCLHSYVWVVV